MQAKTKEMQYALAMLVSMSMSRQALTLASTVNGLLYDDSRCRLVSCIKMQDAVAVANRSTGRDVGPGGRSQHRVSQHGHEISGRAEDNVTQAAQ